MFVCVDLTPVVGKRNEYLDAPWMQKPNTIADILVVGGAEYGLTNGGSSLDSFACFVITRLQPVSVSETMSKLDHLVVNVGRVSPLRRKQMHLGSIMYYYGRLSCHIGLSRLERVGYRSSTHHLGICFVRSIVSSRLMSYPRDKICYARSTLAPSV